MFVSFLGKMRNKYIWNMMNFAQVFFSFYTESPPTNEVHACHKLYLKRWFEGFVCLCYIDLVIHLRPSE